MKKLSEYATKIFRIRKKSLEQRILDNRSHCYKCGTYGHEGNELINVPDKKYYKLICETCRKIK